MPEPLIRSRHVAGAWDPEAGGWSARDFTAGPAGAAGIELPGGVEVDVDVAAPDTLTGLWVPAGPGTGRGPAGQAASDTLVAMLGPDRADELVAMARRGGPPRILRSGPHRDPYPPRIGPGRAAGGVDQTVGRMALALDVADAPGRSALARGLAALDAATAAAELGDSLDFAVRARRFAEEAAGLLRAAAVDGELDGAPVVDGELVRALGATLPLVEGAAARALRGLAEEVAAGRYDLVVEGRAADLAAEREESALPTPAALVEAAPMPVAAAPSRAAAPLLDVVDGATLPARFARARVAARATTASEIEVRVHGNAADAAGWWARAWSPTGVVLAAAPLRAHGPDAVARLLVPPAGLRAVRVDLSDAPAEPGPGAGLRAVAEAVALGRTAARAERLGHRSQARARWQATAEAWNRAGDPARAGLATEYARGRARVAATRTIPPALLADAVVDAAT
jgi:hypothetical protein